MSRANNKSEKKPVALCMVDALTAFMPDGTEDMTEEDIEFDRKASDALLFFAFSLLIIFRIIVALW